MLALVSESMISAFHGLKIGGKFTIQENYQGFYLKYFLACYKIIQSRIIKTSLVRAALKIAMIIISKFRGVLCVVSLSFW